jgi:hypothetical protein
MLEIARGVGTPPKGIILQTRAGHNVANSQSCEPDATIAPRYDKLRRKHFAWVSRKPACGVYNCFGLVWASRRTAIYEESDISLLKEDDGYRKLKIDEEPQVGDIVCYLLHPGNTLHAAIIVELRSLGTSTVPWVLSKWGSVFGEDLHTFLDVPEDLEGCTIEFWTDRPL